MSGDVNKGIKSKLYCVALSQNYSLSEQWLEEDFHLYRYQSTAPVARKCLFFINIVKICLCDELYQAKTPIISQKMNLNIQDLHPHLIRVKMKICTTGKKASKNQSTKVKANYIANTICPTDKIMTREHCDCNGNKNDASISINESYDTFEMRNFKYNTEEPIKSKPLNCSAQSKEQGK